MSKSPFALILQWYQGCQSLPAGLNQYHYLKWSRSCCLYQNDNEHAGLDHFLYSSGWLIPSKRSLSQASDALEINSQENFRIGIEGMRHQMQ